MRAVGWCTFCCSHIWFVSRIEFAYLEVNLGGGWGYSLVVYLPFFFPWGVQLLDYLLFFFPLGSLNMIEILLTAFRVCFGAQKNSIEEEQY